MIYRDAEMAYCGIYCPQCSFRVAAETRNREHLQSMPAKYAELVQSDFDDLMCEGCKANNICGDCTIKDCALTKGFSYCGECGDFPCSAIEAFRDDGIPHHRQAIENLQKIRDIGIEAWFAELQPQLRCACGEKLSWYYRCPHCETT